MHLHNSQIDDILLGTDSMFGGTYRITPADLYAHSTWQDQLKQRLPPNSNVRLELVSGAGG